MKYTNPANVKDKLLQAKVDHQVGPPRHLVQATMYG